LPFDQLGTSEPAELRELAAEVQHRADPRQRVDRAVDLRVPLGVEPSAREEMDDARSRDVADRAYVALEIPAATPVRHRPRNRAGHDASHVDCAVLIGRGPRSGGPADQREVAAEHDVLRTRRNRVYGSVDDPGRDGAH
jgi:hypothetical protein